MKRNALAFNSERGQALVLIVLAIVGIFAFSALAIDMGRIFLARRASQAAADAAALAAAVDASAGSKNPATAVGLAYASAAENGYNNDGVNNWVTVNNPPVGGADCNVCGTGFEDYYQVIIRVHLPPVFAQFFYQGDEQSTVEAVARGPQAQPFTQGDALLSLSKGEDSMVFDGNTNVFVTGGNIRSNGEMIKNGESGAIEALSAHIYYSPEFSSPIKDKGKGKGNGKDPFDPDPEPNPEVGLLNFTQPYCPSAAERATWPSGSGYKYKTINGVTYYYYPSGLSVTSLPAGVHCIDGGIDKGKYTGTNVILVLLSGGIKQTGGDSIDFRGPSDLVDANGHQLGGLVFYAPPSNTSELKFGGNSDAYLQGLFLAPGATCDIGGTPSGVAYRTAFVCYNFKIHGTPDLKITYNPAELLHAAPSLDLIR
jgi:Flp pilus assembly protein TadG